MGSYSDNTPAIHDLAQKMISNSMIDTSLYSKYNVKRGLRDLDGKGVLTGLTDISTIIQNKEVDGKLVPCDGELYYRGYNVNDIVGGILEDDRFGFEVSSVGIESIEFTEQSRQLVQQFASNKMNVAAYEGVSQQAGNMAAQQRIAQGIQDNGFGDGGMLLGMNMAQAINPMTAAPVQAPAPAPAPEAAAPASHTASMSVEEQVEAMKKLKELVDIGILSQEEFDAKKHEILGL